MGGDNEQDHSDEEVDGRAEIADGGVNGAGQGGGGGKSYCAGGYLQDAEEKEEME